MNEYIDISVKDFTPAYTRSAKAFDISVKIIFKTPKWSLTTVRLIGTRFNLTEFLRSRRELDERAIQMHVNAMKSVTVDSANPPAVKNLWLQENRRGA